MTGRDLNLVIINHAISTILSSYDLSVTCHSVYRSICEKCGCIAEVSEASVKFPYLLGFTGLIMDIANNIYANQYHDTSKR